VTTGATCGFKTRSNASWLSLGPSDYKTGAVTITVQPNPGRARTGTVAIADRLVTIHQAAR
jgi:hypothetical protein